MIDIDTSISLPNTNESFLRNETLIDLFKDSVKKYGTKVAIRFKDKSFSYKELDEYSDAIAENLLERGVEPGQIVGIYLPRGYNILLASLGALKAGAGYIPFDRETPVDRVKNVLADVDATFCFCDTSLPEPLVSVGVTLETPSINYVGIN
jgi:non-ribosomal peptide synthetase component F